MKVDGFYVVGRETSGGVVFLQTYTVGGVPTGKHWGGLDFADRYLMLKYAKRAAENAPLPCESDKPAAVWRVEVTAEKETT